MSKINPATPTLDYSKRGTRLPITQTQSEINKFVLWMIALGVIGLILGLIVSAVRG